MASNDIEMRSPAVSSMSISRAGGSSEISAASSISSSVLLPMAETTTTTSASEARVSATREATAMIREASATEVPPNF